jgi:serine/threonine protein phosphatase 1
MLVRHARRLRAFLSGEGEARATLRFLPSPGRLAPGRRVYAVADVHGCHGKLLALHQRIAEDLAARPAAESLLIHLGDYIDRGPDSAGVIRALMDGPAVPVDRVVNLMGNHEEMMLRAVASGDPQLAGPWLANGGAAALLSWGVSPDMPPRHWARLLPRDVLLFLENLPVWHSVDGYVFVHAGMRPGRAIELQAVRDLLWIREPFLSSEADLGTVVVHGHSPVAEPVLRHNRIGLDTGAFATGRLTCAVLEEDRVGFLVA